MMQILTQPKNALVKQYQKLLELDGVSLQFEDEAIGHMAQKALDRKTGARGLRAIFEEIMLNVMFEIPSNENIDKCIVTADAVMNGTEPVLEMVEEGVKRIPKKSLKKAVSGVASREKKTI